MNEKLTEIVFIIDRSGSMHGLESDTIGGFNSMLAKQKSTDCPAFVSTVLFSDNSSVIHDREDLYSVKDMTEDDYETGGCTALLDAVGGAVKHIANVHKYARKEDVPGKTLFIIITDGMENASRNYSGAKVKHLIEESRKKGWEFIFLGANIDAALAAESMGISRSRAVNYACDSAGTKRSYSAMAKACCAVMSAPSACEASECLEASEWHADVDEYYEETVRQNS